MFDEDEIEIFGAQQYELGTNSYRTSYDLPQLHVVLTIFVASLWISCIQSLDFLSVNTLQDVLDHIFFVFSY